MENRVTLLRTDNMPTANSTFAKGGILCIADTFVVAESFVLAINFCAKNPPLRQAQKRYAASLADDSTT
jgi:hypothetical protein